MSAILLLLAILSIATLASRKGEANQFLNIVSTPLLLGIGYLLSYRGLGVISRSSHVDLQTALSLACSWLAFLVGLRASPLSKSSKYILRVLQVSLLTVSAWLVMSVGGALTLFLLKKQDFILLRDFSFLELFGISLLLGGILSGSGYEKRAQESSKAKMKESFIHFLARHDEVIAVIAIFMAIYLWPLDAAVAPVYEYSYVPILIILALGASLAFAQSILEKKHHEHLIASRITLIGLLIFSSGLSHSMFLPDATIAFFAGMILANTGQAKFHFEHEILKSEVPLRLAVFLLVGLELELSFLALFSALLLSAVRLGVKYVERWLLNGKKAGFPLYSFLSSSSLAIPFAYSFISSRPQNEVLDFILATVCLSVSFSDLFTFYRWQRPIWRSMIIKKKLKQRRQLRKT